MQLDCRWTPKFPVATPRTVEINLLFFSNDHARAGGPVSAFNYWTYGLWVQMKGLKIYINVSERALNLQKRRIWRFYHQKFIFLTTFRFYFINFIFPKQHDPDNKTKKRR